jgi:hypothetical protein
MKANELRLGNYVNVPIPEQCPFRIDDFECLSYEFIKVAQKQIINGKEVHPLTWYGNDLQPIPLTEEWLLKFGFKLYEKKVSLNIGGELFNYAMKDEFIIWTDLKSGWTLDSRKDRKTHWLNSLHQLQNLYFALTGEELKLKEDESKAD